MKTSLLGLTLLLPLCLAAQVNLTTQLSVPSVYLITPGVQEYNGNYFVSSAIEKNVVFYPNYPWLKPVQFSLSKFNIQSHSLLGSSVMFGDTLQADSTVVYFQPQIQVKDDRIHLAYTKRIVHDTFSLPIFKQHWWALYYKQLDTNLNVVVPERRLKLVGYSEKLSGLYLQTMNVDDKVTLAFRQSDTSFQFPTDVSKYIQLNMQGDIIREDSLGDPNVTAQNPYHQVAEVTTYPANKYLISGLNLYNVPNVYMMFYIADSTMVKLDTFALKPSNFYNPPDNSGYFVRYPNLLALPTGSIVGGGPYSHGPAGQTHTGLVKCNPGNRFSINKVVSFKQVDAVDGGHTSGPAIHNLVYNKYDNLIYYADVTHSNIGGACNNSQNYVQVICVDTNLNVKWKKYIQVGSNMCAYLGYVEESDQRPGVLISGKAVNTTDPQNPALQIDFLYHLDSALVANVKNSANATVRDRIVVHPNPTKDRMYIDDILGMLSEISIYDMTGQIVKRQKITGKNASISLLEIPSGLYLVRVITKDNEVETLKITKQ